MNILFLVDPLHNYVSDPLYLGLVRLLGQEHVVDFPSKAIFHDPLAKIWFLPQMPAATRSEEEIRSLLADGCFDIVCVASPRPESLAVLSQVFNPVRFPPIVFIDSSDDAKIRHDVVERYPIRVYFKRDYVWKLGSRLRDLGGLVWTFRGDRKLFARTFPLPLSIVLDALPDLGRVDKEIDVSYRGRASHPRRVKAVEILSQMEGVKFSGAVYASPGDRKYKLQAGTLRRLRTKLLDDGLASQADQQQKSLPEAYYREIKASKIAVALRGGGQTASLRYFEIVGLRSLLISDAPETVIPNDFVDRRHAVFCRTDLSDLESLVRHYLREEAEREAIVSEGYAHLLKYHTCERRAEYFLDACRRVL
ncbi:MAG: glycosyltransferase [Nitrospiraceae bacterium]